MMINNRTSTDCWSSKWPSSSNWVNNKWTTVESNMWMTRRTWWLSTPIANCWLPSVSNVRSWEQQQIMCERANNKLSFFLCSPLGSGRNCRHNFESHSTHTFWQQKIKIKNLLKGNKDSWNVTTRNSTKLNQNIALLCAITVRERPVLTDTWEVVWKIYSTIYSKGPLTETKTQF